MKLTKICPCCGTTIALQNDMMEAYNEGKEAQLKELMPAIIDKYLEMFGKAELHRLIDQQAREEAICDGCEYNGLILCERPKGHECVRGYANE